MSDILELTYADVVNIYEREAAFKQRIVFAASVALACYKNNSERLPEAMQELEAALKNESN